MIDDIHGLIDQYWLWLKDKTVLREVNGWIEITTPYLDRHNDYIQLYASRSDGGFVLTDDGYTIADLEQTGCGLDTEKRQSLLKITLNGFGVQLREKRLEVRTSRESFAIRKHNLVQAVLAVNDLFYLASPIVTSLFYEDVVDWLELLDIRYTSRVKFSGQSGFDHMFDFVIPKSRNQPERILRAVNNPNRDTAEALAFAWVDTKDVRSPDSRAYAILNDSSRPVSETVLEALRSYNVRPFKWSEREEARDELAA